MTFLKYNQMRLIVTLVYKTAHLIEAGKLSSQLFLSCSNTQPRERHGKSTWGWVRRWSP